jgi:zinc transporter ZupT
LALVGHFIVSYRNAFITGCLRKKNIGICIMLGILFQIILDFFQKGAEHGHTHGHVNMSHIPWLLFISLCIHAFLEGFPVSHHQDLAVGIAISFTIAIILTIFY